MDIDASIPREELEGCAELLRVLAHPDRLRFVERLLDARLTVGELAAEVALPPAAVSQHLTLMRARGLLSVERVGRAAYYRVSNPHARELIACIRRHARGVSDDAPPGDKK